jgi:hypothetical protein
LKVQKRRNTNAHLQPLTPAATLPETPAPNSTPAPAFELESKIRFFKHCLKQERKAHGLAEKLFMKQIELLERTVDDLRAAYIRNLQLRPRQEAE